MGSAKMKMSKMLALGATLSMMAAPVLAADANPAAKLSVAKSVRANSPAGKKSELAGGGLIIAIIAAAAVVAGIIIIADNDDSN